MSKPQGGLAEDAAHPLLPANGGLRSRYSAPRAMRVSLLFAVVVVIACDKREAFAQGSVGDEAIHSF
jgi:hypothetical protein